MINLDPREKTNIMKSTNIEAGTKGRTKTSTGRSRTRTGRGSGPSVQLATNQDRDDEKVEIDPKIDLEGGTNDPTIGIGLTIGPETTIGMIATTTIPAIADERQVTNITGGIFYLLSFSLPRLKQENYPSLPLVCTDLYYLCNANVYFLYIIVCTKYITDI